MTTALSGFVLSLVLLSILAILADRMRIAYPILFVLGGLGLSVLPPHMQFSLSPEVILPLFLPPLLMEAAYFTSLRDFKINWRPIFQLAFGLVLITMLVVGYVGNALIPGLSLTAALVLGAIIAPPDAVAATATLRYLHIPKRIVHILEGESLVNDAAGLVLYKFSIAALVAGTFSFGEASMSFLWLVVAGVLFGVGLGYAYMRLFPRIRHHSVEMLSTFLLPYIAYFLAEEVHASGVLAVVSCGMVVTWLAPVTFTPSFRLSAKSVWEAVVFVLNAAVFMLIGLEAAAIFDKLTTSELLRYSQYAVMITGIIILLRMVWTFAFAYGWRYLFPRDSDPYPAWQNVFIVGWTACVVWCRWPQHWLFPTPIMLGSLLPTGRSSFFWPWQ